MDNENISIKSLVDSSLLDEVEDECYQILYQQRLLYNERWYSSAFFTKSISLLRWAGLLLSLLGALLCLFYLVYPSSCPRWLIAELYLLLFVIIGLVFYYLPHLHARKLPQLKKAGSNGCKKLAKRMVAKARKYAPYDAEYCIKGDLVSYFRGKDKQWQQLWSRRLKGYAVISEHATVFFRKPTSIQPTMLILYDSHDVTESVLMELGLPYKMIV